MKGTLREGGDRSARTNSPCNTINPQKIEGERPALERSKGPSPSMANHVLDLIFKPLNP